MTDNRISLEHLRDWFDRDGPGVERIWAYEVVAAVDAVKAARTYQAAVESEPADGGIALQVTYRDLVEALERFDFGEQP